MAQSLVAPENCSHHIVTVLHSANGLQKALQLSVQQLLVGVVARHKGNQKLVQPPEHHTSPVLVLT